MINLKIFLQIFTKKMI